MIVSCLVLGNDESGKSTLISKLRGKEDDISKGHGLEYTYLDVHDEELDGKYWEFPLQMQLKCVFSRVIFIYFS